MKVSRRKFVHTASSVLAVAPSIWLNSSGRSPAKVLNHGVIGAGPQGRAHVRRFDGVEACRVIAVCDVDPARLEQVAQIPAEQSRVKSYLHYRKLLEDPDVETVSIATCDHWHAPMALEAMLAGKDVYVEKPCSHNIRETQLLVQCAAERGRCLQHGTQRRSSARDMAAIQALREGIVGEVFAAKAINHQLRNQIGVAPVEAPPPGVDYDLWLGPAPDQPFTRNRWHYNWHWFWDYGGGDLVNDGVHQLDVAVWGMGLDQQYPRSILATGTQLWYEDDHETPDTQTVIYDYGDRQILYEMRLWTPYEMEGQENGTVFYGTRGRLEVGRGLPVAVLDGRRVEILPEEYEIVSESIVENFLTAVRFGDPSRLRSPVSLGAVSVNLCHLGNIGTRCGGMRLTYDSEAGVIRAAEKEGAANRLIGREYRKGYELAYTG